MLKWFFDYLYWFQIFKDQEGSVPSITVAVLVPVKSQNVENFHLGDTAKDPLLIF